MSEWNADTSSVPSTRGRSRDDRHEESWHGKRHGKEVDVRLEVKYADKKIGRVVEDGDTKVWDRVQLRSYNGELVGPTIEAEPGDTLNIALENKLPADHHPGSDDPNEPHGFNITNLHFHGMHVSPAGNADNVLIAVGPNERFHYEVKIPRNHPAGTFWYHPHKHGSVALQIASGMAGALIIRGDIDEVHAIEDADERILIFQQHAYAVGADGIGRLESYQSIPFPEWLKLGLRISINGEVEPTLKLCPGEVQRWRFINACFSESLLLKLIKSDPQTGTAIPISQYQIALDGLTTGYLDKVNETELHPGYRADVLVRATDDNGNALPEGVYWLVDDGIPRKTLARIVVRGKRKRMDLPTEQELRPLAPFKPIEDSETTGTQVAEYSVDLGPPPRFMINNKPYDPHAPPRKLKVGAVEKWIVSNPPGPGLHSFHIHVNPFMYKRPDGRVVWKDTLQMPVGSRFELWTRYDRYIGTFVNHCHVLDHEDFGMMETLEIIPPRMAHEHPPH